MKKEAHNIYYLKMNNKIINLKKILNKIYLHKLKIQKKKKIHQYIVNLQKIKHQQLKQNKTSIMI